MKAKVIYMFSKIINFIKSHKKKKSIYDLGEVFTPTSAANISYIERKAIENRLSKALDIRGKQIVIYGHSGSGKTTILHHILKDKSVNKITSRCTSTSTIESIIFDAFDELNPYYVQYYSSGNKQNVNGKLSSEYLGIKSKINVSNEISTTETKARVLPPQLTLQRLGQFIGQANAIWIIEDFHKVSDSEKTKISQTLKLFMDMAEEYPTLKIVVVGAAEHGYEIVAHDKELNNRISEISVPLLEEAEIKKIIEKGCLALNIKFENELMQKIAKYSNCLATIAHQLAYNLCYNRNVKKTVKSTITISVSELDNAINDFSYEKEDTYEQLYNTITQQRKGIFQNVEIILKTLSEINSEWITQNELFTEIRKRFPNYPLGNLSTYIKQLTSAKGEETLRANSGKISFSDPFFKSYVKMFNYQ